MAGILLLAGTILQSEADIQATLESPAPDLPEMTQEPGLLCILLTANVTGGTIGHG